MVDSETVNWECVPGNFRQNSLLVANLAISDENDLAAALRREALMDAQDMSQRRQQFSSSICAEFGDRLEIGVPQERVAFYGFFSEVTVIGLEESDPDTVTPSCGLDEGGEGLGRFGPFLSGHAPGAINE